MHALIDSQSIVIIEGETTLMVPASDPAHARVRQYLVEEKGQDFERVRALVDVVRVGVKTAVAEAMAVVDEPASGGSTDEPTYRMVHGDPVEEVVFTTALRLSSETGDLAPLGAFLRRLERNPSQASRSQLFGWLKAGGFTITTTGMIVGYKSVREDGLSASAGREPVTVVHQDGTVEQVSGRVPYPVGATVWMERGLVNPDRQSACSVGLHVGTFSYAENFSEQLLVVLVDPADVVSVPVDCAAQKMRVCRLYVAACHDGEQITDAVISSIRTVPNFEATEEYVGRPENTPARTFAVAVSLDTDDDDETDYDYPDFGDDADSDEDDDDADSAEDDSDGDGFNLYTMCTILDGHSE